MEPAAAGEREAAEVVVEKGDGRGVLELCAQRLADIQKVVSPAVPAAAASQPAAAETTAPAAHPTSNITESPSFQFGGPNGSLAMPPYMAPSR